MFEHFCITITIYITNGDESIMFSNMYQVTQMIVCKLCIFCLWNNSTLDYISYRKKEIIKFALEMWTLYENNHQVRYTSLNSYSSKRLEGFIKCTSTTRKKATQCISKHITTILSNAGKPFEIGNRKKDIPIATKPIEKKLNPRTLDDERKITSKIKLSHCYIL